MADEKENIGSRIDNPYFLRFLLYFLIVIIVIGVIVGLVFVVQQGKQNDIQNKVLVKLNQTVLKVNQTLAAVNFTQQQIHEDQGRENQTEKQNKYEMLGRSNQSRALINETKNIILDHHEKLMTYIVQQNDTMRKMFKEINDSQQQNEDIKETQKDISLANNKMLKKFGNENNAFARAIMQKLGLNTTKVLEDYYKSSNNTVNIGNSTTTTAN